MSSTYDGDIYCGHCEQIIPRGVGAGLIKQILRPVTPGQIDGAWMRLEVTIHRTCLEDYSRTD